MANLQPPPIWKFQTHPGPDTGVSTLTFLEGPVILGASRGARAPPEKKEKKRKEKKREKRGKREKKEERERKKRKGRKRERKKENKNICFSYLLNTGAPVHLLSFFERARGNLVGAFEAPLDK